jgi:FdhD protein
MASRPTEDLPVTVWRDGVVRAGRRALADETAVALTYDGTTQAVMMATPQDLEDFAVGFSLTEGIIAAASEIETLEVIATDLGTDVQMRLKVDRGEALKARRRAMAGPVGCGLCGIESLAEAMRDLPKVPAGRPIPAAEIAAALRRLPPLQMLNRETRAVHAAAFVGPDSPEPLVREDVGRHNALDKLAGAVARAGMDAAAGFIIVTSRLSIEMIQKTAIIGAPVLVAVSAPTALAVRTAEASGLTLAVVARDDGFEIATHPQRIVFPHADRRAIA